LNSLSEFTTSLTAGRTASAAFSRITQILAQTDDAYAAVLPKLEQHPISGNDGVCMACERAFQDTIVGLVLYNMEFSPRFDGSGEFRKKHGDVCELFGIPRELAAEYAKQFVEDGFGENKLILFRCYAPQSRFAPAPREHQSRDKNFGVENDLHPRR
jgi:hypothetical protein